jgi:hypothetical protein
MFIANERSLEASVDAKFVFAVFQEQTNLLLLKGPGQTFDP